MTSISIISTQLQLINCVEYIKEHNVANNVLIVDAINSSRLTQIMQLLNSKLYSNIFEKIYYRSISNYKLFYLDIIYLKLLILYLSIFFKFDYAIIGNYKALQHKYLFLCSLKFKKDVKYIVVDDGTLSFFYKELRDYELNNIRKASNSISRSLKFVFFESFIARFMHRIEFFSLYSLSVSELDCLSHNSLTYLKQNIGKLELAVDFSQYKTLIIGQPFVQMKYFDVCALKRIIDFISKKVKIEEVLYVCHPAEDEAIIESLGLRAVKLPIPFECLVKLFPLDTNIYGVTSTALINAKVEEPSLNVIAIDISLLLAGDATKKETFSKIYNMFAEYKIQIDKLV